MVSGGGWGDEEVLKRMFRSRVAKTRRWCGEEGGVRRECEVKMMIYFDTPWTRTLTIYFLVPCRYSYFQFIIIAYSCGSDGLFLP